MATHPTRREFLAQVGGSAIAASLGFGLSSELRMFSALAGDGPEPLAFGPLEPLVALMQETAPEGLLFALVERLRGGTDLRTLVAAAALANARTFGGEDYVGFHTEMALAPAYRMALELPTAQRPLPVLKVLYRNTTRIQEFGGRKSEVLRALAPATVPAGRANGPALRDAVRARDLAAAEGTLAAVEAASPAATLDQLLYAVEDQTEVHRVVLPHRCRDLLDVIGAEHALTMLRTSVRYCVKEEGRANAAANPVRALLPALLEEHHLLERALGTEAPDDAWLDLTSQKVLEGTPEQAAEIAAAALERGVAPAAIGEAISLAANQLVLRDAGRTSKEVRPGKPAGSVHGDSIGVHASDSANAWRGLAAVASPRNAFACLILGAYQVAHDRTARGGDFLAWKPRPFPEEVAAVTATDPADLLRATDGAVRDKDQGRACALVARYGALGHEARPLLDVLLRYAVSEDGALHAEKYYRTASEEFATTRKAFRWRHLTALARVTASEYGQRAPGYEEAVRRLEA